MKKTLFWLSLCVIFTPLGFSALRAEMDPELKQQILTTTDESFLIELLKRPGDSDDDVFMKNLIVKRLMTVGTRACVPVLLELLGDERQSYNARFALEALEGEEINPALEKRAAEMTGPMAVDLVASLGARRDAAAVPTLRSLLETENASPEMKRAVWTALGFIASDDAMALLIESAQKTDGLDADSLRVLGNALIFAGKMVEKGGNPEAATALYRAVMGERFPAPLRRTAEIHALATGGGDSIPAVIEKIGAENESERKTALAVIPLLPVAAGESLVAAVRENFDSWKTPGGADAEIPARPVQETHAYDTAAEAPQGAVLTALSGRTDEATRRVFLPFLKEKAAGDDMGIRLAALRIYRRFDYNACPETVADALALADILYDRPECAALLPNLTLALYPIPRPEIDQWLTRRLTRYQADGTAKKTDDLSAARMVNLLDLVRWRRPAGIDSLLSELLTAENLDPDVRNATFVALAETVPVERLTAFIERTAGLGGDVPSVLLNRACSRLPRQACAREVIALFERSDAEVRGPLMEVLRQIGGNDAVDCVVAAALEPETVDAATATLGQWDQQADMERVADACLDLAKRLPSGKYRIRVVKGFIRVPRQFALPAEKRIAMADTAFALEGRDEDRELVFDIFSRIVDVRAVAAAMRYAEDETWREKACETAVTLAEKINLTTDTTWGWYTLDPDKVRAEEEQRAAQRRTLVELMERADKTTQNGDLAARARAVADRYR